MASQGFKDFDGAVALVTGGSSGIGLAVAKALIARGCNVAIAARDATKTASVAAKIGAFPVSVDVSSLESVQIMADVVMERFGKVNILCNNAGVGPIGRIEDLSIEDWRWMLDVNLWGVLYGINVFLPHLMAAPGGAHIVNTASLAALWPVPRFGSYYVAKAGVVAATETLHAELAETSDRVGATVLCPGPIPSEMHTSLRGRSDSVGGLVDYDIRGMFPPELFLPAEICAAAVIDAIENNHLYVMTHPDLGASGVARQARMAAAFEHMRTIIDTYPTPQTLPDL